MSLYENLIRDKKVLSAITISTFGLFLNFIGICMGQGELRIPEGATNPIGIYWYYLFFYIITLGSIVGASATASTHSYRIVLCSLISITLSYVPNNVETFLVLSTVKQTGNAGGLAVAGLVLFILPLFPLLILIGCEEDTPLSKGLSIEQLKLKGFKFGESTSTLGQNERTSRV